MSVWVGNKGLIVATAVISLAALSSCANPAKTSTPSTSSSSTSSSASASASATSTSTTSSAPSAGTPSSSTPATPPATLPATAGGPGGTPICAASMLAGSLDASGGGAAGSVYMKLIVTNTSAASCTLYGFPGVSLVGYGNGTQLGAPADRDESNPPVTIALAPGAKAAAVLRYTNAQNYMDRCAQVPADGFRVYPPSATDALFIASPRTACSNADIKLLTIGAFQPM